MEPNKNKTIPQGSEWIHEIKWDGIRGVSQVNDDAFEIFTKKGNKRGTYFPELKQINKLLKCDNALLDGEIVVFNELNKPSFQDILIRERSKGVHAAHYQKIKPVHYIVFDCLAVNDEDIRQKPLNERKDILKEILIENETIAISRTFNDGDQLYHLMKEKSYEGVVSKNKDSPYIAGKKHDYWYKNKISRKILGVVGGIHMKSGQPASIPIGIYRDNQLIYIGNVSIGLKQEEMQLLYQYAHQLKRDEAPFINLPYQEDTIWFNPLLTCWIHFFEWTNDGHLRHAKIQGFTKMKPDEASGEELVE
ncbi:non-homologous end-joining DNA ligase [Vallitalea okinawensis]|uniref:non-homologous end-joining DNA ligase n=1 Tax=Vallitalea okinawensis TaxID=2078660 RepID=UPI0013007D63|nr:non-homologous end-joining DNA ligase [Vallitalea okinawensis]